MNITFHVYGLLIGIGIIVSVQISVWLAKRRGYSSQIIRNGLWWAIVPGIIGARLYHVIDLWNSFYRFNPLNILYIWNGGLAIYGALLGGFVGLYLYWLLEIRNSLKIVPLSGKNLKLKIQFLDLLNIIAFSLPLAQSIGRIGNYLNQELYGLPSSLPWAIRIDGQSYHPLFAYEAIWMSLGFVIMLISDKGLAFKGRACGLARIRNNFFAFYLFWYGIGRFFLEFLRLHPSLLAQAISLCMIITSLVLYARRPKI